MAAMKVVAREQGMWWRDFSLYILSLSAFACLTTHAWHQATPRKIEPAKVKLWVTGAEIDVEEMRGLAQLDINELIQKIRKDFGVKVLVLNKPVGGEQPNPELKVINEPGHEEGVAFYSDKIDSLTTLGQKMAGMFLEPHLNLNQDATEVSELGTRPLESEPLIVVYNSVNKGTLLHELMHYLIYRSEGRQSDVLEGKKMSKLSFATFRAKQLHGDLIKIQKKMKEAKSKQEFGHYFLQFEERQIFKLIALLYRFQHSLSEELDITRYQIENAQILGLDERKTASNLRYYRAALEEILKFREDVSTFLNSEEFKLAAPRFSEQGKGATKLLAESVDKMTPVWIRAADWFNNEIQRKK